MNIYLDKTGIGVDKAFKSVRWLKKRAQTLEIRTHGLITDHGLYIAAHEFIRFILFCGQSLLKINNNNK